MSNNLAIGMVIGGAIGASFGKAISDCSAKIDIFKK
jgi:predicted TIM-barrel enzyme